MAVGGIVMVSKQTKRKDSQALRVRADRAVSHHLSSVPAFLKLTVALAPTGVRIISPSATCTSTATGEG